MTTRRPTKKAAADTPARPSASVADFLAQPNQAHAAALAAVREIILSASPEIREGIKWNTPSFWRGEWFATFHLRNKSGLMLILHRGAKTKTSAPQPALPDPAGLLQWLAPDRAAVVFTGADDVPAKAAALRPLIRQWSQQVADASKHA